MPPRSRRLTRVQVEAVRSRGRAFYGEHITLRALPSSETAAAVVVSKKVARTAVERHRIKRRAGHALKVCLANIDPPHHLVLFVKGSGARLKYGELVEEIGALIRRMNQ